jgi:hypothetical protein
MVAVPWILGTRRATAWFYAVPEVREHMLRHRIRYLFVPIGLIAGTAVLAGVSHGAGSTTILKRRAITAAGIAGIAGIVAKPTLLDL